MGGKLCASLPITHLRSIPHLFTTPPNHPYFSPSIIPPPYLQFFKPLEIRQKLHLPIYPFNTLLVFWFVSTQRLFLVFPSIPHRALCNFWKGFTIEIFGSRSTLLLRFLQDTLLTNWCSGVPGFHRRSLFFPPPSAQQRVAYTRQRVLRSRRLVATTSAPSASQRLGHQWFRVKPAFPNAERPPVCGAWTSHAVKEGSHPFSFNRTSDAFVFVLLFFWAYLLFSSPHVYPCFDNWVLVTQFTCDITFTGDPGFVASVPRVNRPSSSEVLPPRTFVHSLNFGLPKLCYVGAFYFLM
jgi:hypothetical protein